MHWRLSFKWFLDTIEDISTLEDYNSINIYIPNKRFFIGM